jgi:hypothetical protein
VKPALIGKDPLDIEPLFSGLGDRTDGSAHSLMRAISGIKWRCGILPARFWRCDVDVSADSETGRGYDHAARAVNSTRKPAPTGQPRSKPILRDSRAQIQPQPDPPTAGVDEDGAGGGGRR